jgi:hypothetical protein
MTPYDHLIPETLQLSAEKFAGAAMACLALCVVGCGEPAPVAAVETPTCGTDGSLVAEIYGGVRASIDWEGGTLECEGMPRPNGEGARLRFAGTAATANGDLKLAFIFGLPNLIEGETARELPTNVTLMEEGSGRFYGTREAANCWTDIDLHEPVEPAGSSSYRIGGVLYCVAPLADLNGNASISFADLEFTGRLDWR